jgi:hypothetical protein
VGWKYNNQVNQPIKLSENDLIHLEPSSRHSRNTSNLAHHVFPNPNTHPQSRSHRRKLPPFPFTPPNTNPPPQGSGQIGAHFLKSLLATGKHDITVLTRTESTATFPSNVHVAKVDFSAEKEVEEALRGHDFLIISLSVQAPPTLHASIVNAAVSAGIKYIMPNYYGGALPPRNAPGPVNPMFAGFIKTVEDVEKAGATYVAMCSSFWYEFSLGMGEPWFGFNIKERKVTFYGTGEKRIDTSTWEVCGEAVAALLSLPVEKSADGKPALQDWANKGLYVSSFLVSQREMLDSLHRVLGTTDKDWTIRYQDVEERYKEGVEQLQAGNRVGFAQAMYASVFRENAPTFDKTGGVDNRVLGVKEESLDEATKRAVEMVKGGFGYHQFLVDGEQEQVK